MSYIDQLRQASFRGFEFFVTSSQVAGGRRAIQHQYPNRETPYTEDLGREAKSYQVEGHVIGQDYLAAKNRLFEVFEKKGPGELIHPFYGSLMVQVSSLNVSESIKQGAIATFSVTFLELGDSRFPKGSNDKGSILSENVTLAEASIKEDFDNNFSITGLPEFAIQSARDLISKAQELFDNTTKPISDIAEGVAELSFATRNLVAETNDLLQSPQELSQRLLDSFNLMESAITTNRNKKNAYSAFYDFTGDDEIPENTPTRVQESNNKKVFENFMRRAAAVKSTQPAIVTDFSFIDEAHEARQEISSVLENQIREISVSETNTDLLQAMEDVNASLVDALPDPDAQLPSIIKKTPETDEVSILLAYNLNESLDNEQDIITRNSIRHPGFIPAKEELEVIDGR